MSIADAAKLWLRKHEEKSAEFLVYVSSLQELFNQSTWKAYLVHYCGHDS